MIGSAKGVALSRAAGILSLFLALSFVQIPASAQAPPDVSQGINPTTTYHGSDIDLVDTVTSRLNIHIPLIVDHSQRGDLNFQYSLYGNGSTWYPRQNCTKTGCNYKWWPLAGGGVYIEADGSLGTVLGVTRCSITTCGYNATAYEAFAADGGVHPMATITSTPFVAESLDGSGIRYIVNSSSVGVLIDKQGLQYSEPSLNVNTGAYTDLIEDANGNEMTSSGNVTTTSPTVMTDTLGRAWTQTFGSTNVTGCPTGGPVAPTSSSTWIVPAPASVNNGMRQFKFCYSSVPIQTNFGQAGTTEYASTWRLTTGVVLPDGTTWRFDYNSYADVVKIVLPTGGTITYQWQIGDPCNSGNGLEIISSRTVSDGTNSNTWKYSPWNIGPTYALKVTDPLGNDTVYSWGAATAPPQGPVGGCPLGTGEIQYFQGPYDSGALLKTVTKAYVVIPNPYLWDLQSGGADPILLTGITDAYPNGATSQTQQTFDVGFTFTDWNNCCGNEGKWQGAYGLVIAKSNYDYGSGGSGPIISTASTNYLALSNTNYLNANLLTLPSSVVTTNGNGYQCSETDYAYDAAPQIVSSGVTMQHLAAPNPGVLGDLTSVTYQLYSNPCQSSSPSKTPLTTNRYVYDTGMLQKSVDPLGNPTTYSYSSSYYGAYPTTVTNALNQSTNYSYDFNSSNNTGSGRMLSVKDANSQATSFSFDCMLRPTQANYPDGGQDSVTFGYNPSNGGCGTSVTSTFEYATLTKKITSSLNKVKTQIFDGLGREIQTRAVVPTTTCSSGDLYTDTTYDADGRRFSASNPYCTTGDATYGLTKTYYDPLKRPCLVVPPDGVAPSTYSCPTTSPGNDILTTYLGNASTTTDQAGIQRRSLSDGLGRLIEVDESGPGTGTATDATGIVSVYGSEDKYVNVNGQFVPDTGTVWVTVNGHTDSVTYGQGSTPGSIASALVSAVNSDNTASVTATANGTYLTLTSKTTGSSSDYALSAGSSSLYAPTYISAPSFGASGASPTLSCGSSGSSSVYSLCTPIVTAYAYDPLSDLVSALQAGSHQRSFVFDSMSHLTQATNPESGTTTYVYDADGNVLTKTDARGITTNYSPSNSSIDPLNRVRGKTYSNGDPEITYAYDGNAPVGCTPPALTDPNPIGRRTSMCDAAGSEAWSYDPMGRVTQDGRTTNSITKTTTYSTPTVPYNYDGSIAQLTYPSGRTITYSPNTAAQPISAVDTANSINYATMALYAPQGDLRSLTSGNGAGILSTLYYNDRLQPCRIAVNSSGTAPGSCGDGTNHGNLLDYTYSFDLSTVNGPCSTSFTSPTNSGDVASIADNVTSAKGENFCYDVENRLAKAETVSTSGSYCWGEQYGYDSWGNLLSMTAITQQYNGCTQESGFTFLATANNQISGFCYDADGNLLAQSAPPCSSPTYSYNGQNQLISTGGVTYTYDGDGQRVQKSNGKLYWYETGGNVLDETDASGNFTYEYIFFGGKRIARRDSTGNVEYYFADHLGSARIVTSASGSSLETCTYFPFGGSNCIPSSVNNYLFTGKERDSESGLDDFGARYFTSQYGRFMSPDSVPIAGKLLLNPEDLNLYSYSINNPIRYNDPNGKDWQTAWNDLKTFAGSLYGKLSFGAGIDAKVKIGSGEAKVGVDAKYSWEQHGNGNGTATVSESVGAKAGEPGGPQAGLSVEASKVLTRVNGEGGPLVTGPEMRTVETTVGMETETKGGSIGASGPSEDVGLGLEVGALLHLGIEVGTTNEGIAAFSDFVTQVKNEISTPKPPTPPPPPPPDNTNIPHKDEGYGVSETN
jgi:RHS repeat-associated protein